MPDVRKITQREANLMKEFGFQWAHGKDFEVVAYDKIQSVTPTEDGCLVHYTEKCEFESSLAQVVAVDIPKGNFSSSYQTKNLDTAWIFVYYLHITDMHRDGRILERP